MSKALKNWMLILYATITGPYSISISYLLQFQTLQILCWCWMQRKRTIEIIIIVFPEGLPLTFSPIDKALPRIDRVYISQPSVLSLSLFYYLFLAIIVVHILKGQSPTEKNGSNKKGTVEKL